MLEAADNKKIWANWEEIVRFRRQNDTFLNKIIIEFLIDWSALYGHVCFVWLSYLSNRTLTRNFRQRNSDGTWNAYL